MPEKTKRLISYLIDWYILSLIYTGPFIYFGSIYLNETFTVINFNDFPESFTIKILLLATFLTILYLVVLPKKYGQTIGKKFMGIKIVKEDGSKLSYLDLFKRGIVGMLIIEGAIFSISLEYVRYFQVYYGLDLPNYANLIPIVILIISIGLSFKSKKGKMIHDYISNTQVVSMEGKNE